MKELRTIIEHVVPEIGSTDTWKRSYTRWMRNYNELQHLRIRRPELYEAAVTALANHIANRALIELGRAPLLVEDQRKSKPFRDVKKGSKV